MNLFLLRQSWHFGSTGMIEDTYHHLGSAENCQKQCGKNAGCSNFVYYGPTDECELYQYRDSLEYNEDKDVVYGKRSGCIDCFKRGFDYVVTGSGHNLIGFSSIEGVESVLDCSKICAVSSLCAYVRYILR